MTSRRDMIKPLVFAACLLPLAWLAARAVLIDGLGANPIETINRFLGDWALRMLLLALAVTPLRRMGWRSAMRLRRMLGLFAFFYVCLHVASYVALDHFFDWAAIGKDIVKRTYITIGMTAFVLLLPLAVTSTNAMIRRLGAARWRRLHQLVYGIAVLAVVHYWMMVKADIGQPLLHALILAGLLAFRLPRLPIRAAAP